MNPIKLLILDVDGVLTSGALPYSSAGNEVKTFHVQDGSAIKLWQRTGGLVAIISGRAAHSVSIRAEELGVATVVQGVPEKISSFETVCRQAGISEHEAAFVGDDLLDLGPMQRCGYPIAVANAVPAVKRTARHVTRRRGGEGAVMEAVERLLRHNDTWKEVLAGLADDQS